jgi:hypothetical protein
VITDQLLALTASDAWLTAEQITQLLETADYWRWGDTYVPPDARVHWVRTWLTTQRGPNGALLFASVDMRADDGRVVSVYKQERLFSAANRRTVVGLAKQEAPRTAPAAAMMRRPSRQVVYGSTGIGRHSA